MHLLIFLLPLFLGSGTVQALLTLQTMRDLAATTDECRGRIEELGEVRFMGGVGQAVFGLESGGRGDEPDEGEVEETVSAALRIICSDILIELEKPLSASSTEPQTPARCKTTIAEFHTFLESTVKFLHNVQERQMYHHWDAGSPVAAGVVWMQRLWASRKGNSQQRSFIEQQMSLYASTGCFGKSMEVLRRDVEVVEYLNDLIDEFP